MENGRLVTQPPLSSAAQKRHAPSAARNRAAIGDVLRQFLPERGAVLEIASGSGEHAIHFAAAFPGIIWQPSDADPEAIASIAAWSAEAALPNLRPALALDVQTLPWPGIADGTLVHGGVDAVIAINMIHISPWESCLGLMAGAASLLKESGFLLLYGPFKLDGRHTAPSNAAFDDELRTRDPRFGVRDVAEVARAAAARGLIEEKRISMPTNNLSLVFRKKTPAD
jgi:hypothetical protein